MIAVDTSALMAIARNELQAKVCMAALERPGRIVISAGTMVEALIVAHGRSVGQEMTNLFAKFDFDVIPVTAATARRIGDIYARWGRGAKSAGLNFGDCFAYDVAKEHRCRLLYVGRDFAKTDIGGVLGKT